MKRVFLAAVAVLILASCAPLLPVLVDVWEHEDGAVLHYIVRDSPGYESGGLEFNPDGRTARGAQVSADGFNMQLLSFPAEAVCTVTATLIECDLGDVDTTTFIGVSGQDVIATASWRREGGNEVYRILARLPGDAP